MRGLRGVGRIGSMSTRDREGDREVSEQWERFGERGVCPQEKCSPVPFFSCCQKATLLSFVFNNFSESGLFNELRLIQIKKIALFPTRVPGCARRLPEDMPNPPGRLGAGFGLRKCILCISEFVNSLQLRFGPAPSAMT
jgi:hypothetical protein